VLLSLFLFAIVVFVIAYRVYGSYQRKVYGLDDSRETPARSINDGMDYCPAHPAVLLGHHFSSIAGAGPVVGPIVAASLFGWLPAYIWIIVGCIFFGGVHDMGSLVASIRHKGLSVGEVVSQWIGAKGKRLFLVFTWLALILVVAVFLELAAQTFAADPVVAFSGCLYIGLAMVFGVLIYRYGVSLTVTSVVMVPIVLGAVFYGSAAPWVNSAFTLSLDSWRWILVFYIFGASVLPVWLLLQPRDYLASYLLYFSLFIGAVGMIFGGSQFPVKLPAFKGFVTAGGEFVWPLLFVTVACGAISGFHSLVGSGTTSKQIRKESDSVLVGYGSMLIEGVVAVIALGTIMMSGQIVKGGPTVVYGQGLGQFAALLGIDPKIGMSLGLLALNSFILTSLDTATRLARYQFQEFFNMKVDRYTATAVGVALALVLIFWKTGDKPVWQLVWPVFGASNQLVAAMALLAIGVWVIRGLKKPAKFIMIPMAFMLITTLVALVLLIKTNINNPLLSGIAVLLLILAGLLMKEAWSVLTMDKSVPKDNNIIQS
jgi:carbon starvation protein